MFSFLKKPAPQSDVVEEVKKDAELPEGCEALFECELSDIGGGLSTVVHMAL
jgi:hypothetical protein